MNLRHSRHDVNHSTATDFAKLRLTSSDVINLRVNLLLQELSVPGAPTKNPPKRVFIESAQHHLLRRILRIPNIAIKLAMKIIAHSLRVGIAAGAATDLVSVTLLAVAIAPPLWQKPAG